MPRAVLAAEPACLEVLHDLLAELWAQAPDVAAGERDRFTLALAELVGNVVAHGRTAAGTTPQLELDVSATPGRLEAELRDDGLPVPDPGRDVLPAVEAESGRGLPLVHAALDEVHYARLPEGNRWRVALVRGLRPR